MTSTSTHTPWARLGALALALSFAVSVIVLAFSWPGVTSEPKDLPVAIAGPTEQVSALTGAAPTVIAFVDVDDRAAAIAAISNRSVYGAVILGSEPEVLVASAAGSAPVQLLSQFASQLQTQLNSIAAAQAAATGREAPAITVTITDVVPLADSDPRGIGLTAAFFPLVLGGMLGGIAISVVVIGALRRVITVVAYSATAGFVVAAILQGWLGTLQGDYLLNALGFTIALLAIAAPIVGIVSIVGRAGLALGPVIFLLFANPISAATLPVEFLAAPWGAIGQWFPPGAGATLVRDLSYFPDADASFAWLVLAGWATAGLILGLVGHARAGRAAAAVEGMSS